MPLLIPEEIDPATPASERKVREQLQSQLPRDWIVIHAKRFFFPQTLDTPKAEGECDFLILNPQRGFFGLEVKGGGVGRDDQGWFSIDRNGRRHSIRDPGRQSQQAVHTISRYLKSRHDFSGHHDQIRFGWGVVFPDIKIERSLGPELPRELIIDFDDLSDMPAALLSIASAHDMRPTRIPPQTQIAFLKIIAPNAVLVPSLATRLEGESEVLIRLTEEQKEILELLGDAPRVGIRGSAGTGKTLLALEVARRWVADGRRVLFLCYNRFLAAHLTSTAEGVTVRHFHAFCREMASGAGLPFKPPKEADDVFWDETAPQLLETAIDYLPDERWDAIVIDEGQDFKDLWWLVIQKLLKQPSEGRVWVFYDPKQDIYGGAQTELLDLTPANLTFNCRNTKAIAIYAHAFIGDPPRLKTYAPEGIDPLEHICSSEAAMLEAMRKTLHELVIKERLAPDRIVILSPRSPRTSRVWAKRTFGKLELVEFPVRPGSNQIAFASIQAFKGLEADAVILCEIDEGEVRSALHLLYLAASRAKHVLAVLRYGSQSSC